MKKILVLGGGLIALYLVLANAKGATALLSGATSGASNVAKTLQGRG